MKTALLQFDFLKDIHEHERPPEKAAQKLKYK